MNRKDEFRVTIFKRILKSKGITLLNEASSEELLEILNASVLPNAASLNAVKNSYFFGKLFMHGRREHAKLENDIKLLDVLYENISPAEKTLFRFGLFNGFSSSNWRKEMFRYINLPIGNNVNLGGRKLIYSKRFQEIFDFVYNVISKGEKNGRFPKF